MSVEAYVAALVKGMSNSRLDALIDNIEFTGYAALPAAVGLYNINHILDNLKAEKAKRTIGTILPPGFRGSPVGGGVRLPAKPPIQAGPPTHAGPEEKEEPPPRETIIDIQPLPSTAKTGMRNRLKPAPKPRLPKPAPKPVPRTAAPIIPSEIGGFLEGDDLPLQDIELGNEQQPPKLPKPNRRMPKIPSISRIGAGIAGVGGITIAEIITQYGYIEKRPDGSVIAKKPDGTEVVFTPDMIKPENTTDQLPQSVSGGVGGGSSFGTKPLNISGKYRDPRKGRHNYILFEAYSDNASSAGVGKANSDI